MVPHIPEPGEPLESKEEKMVRFIGRWVIIGVFLWIIVSIIHGIGDYIDLFVNGPVPLRPGYIPKAYRIHDKVMFVPKGEDARLYVKPSYLKEYKRSLKQNSNP